MYGILSIRLPNRVEHDPRRGNSEEGEGDGAMWLPSHPHILHPGVDHSDPVERVQSGNLHDITAKYVVRTFLLLPIVTNVPHDDVCLRIGNLAVTAQARSKQ